MIIVAVLLMVVSCIALRDESPIDGSVEIDVEKYSNSPPKTCLDELNRCLARRICYSRAKEMDIACCQSSFTNGSFNRTAEKDCMEDKFQTDVEDCIDQLHIGCIYAVYLYFEEREDKFDKIEDKIKDAVDKPKHEGQCKKYSDETEEEEWLMCKKNKDEDVAWICDLLMLIMDNSPLAERTCMEDFGKCVVRALPMLKMENASIDCCRESIANRNEYHDLFESCLKKKLGPVFMKCMKDTSKECTPLLIGKYMEDKEAIDGVRKTIDSLVGVPNNVLYCKARFIQSVKMLLAICQTSSDEKLKYFCKLSQRILQYPDGFKECDEYSESQNEHPPEATA